GKSGNYFAVFYDGSRDPKETSIALKTKRKNQAMAKFVKLAKEVEAGGFDPWDPEDLKPSRLTLAEAMEAFLTEKKDRRPKTLYAYRLALSGLLKKEHTPPALMVAHLRQEHVRSYIEAPKRNGSAKDTTEVTVATKRHRYRHLSVFVRWAMEKGYLRRNPIEGIAMPRLGKRVPEFLTPTELERILTAIDAYVDLKQPGGHIRDGEVLWLKDFILVAVGTGMRLSEVCSLRWSDVDFESGFVTVRNREDFRTKSGHERRIPLVGDAFAVLKRRHTERTDDLDGPALTYGDGRPVRPEYASKRFKKFARLAKVPERIKFHSLRHTCASWLTMKGVSPAIIQQILGHADISTTMIYSHLAPDVMKKAMESAFAPQE
ncbi:MAG: site-specific integrase, partial [Rhodothermia bacterium]|nr:site-specific integrase [Rhodothermia bacterium]